MSPSEDETATDGGTAESDPLEVLRDSETAESATFQERVRQWVDLWILAPGRVMWQDYRTRYGSAIILFFVLLGTLGVRTVAKPVQNKGPAYVQPFDPGYVITPWNLAPFTVDLGVASWTYTGIWQFPLGTNGFGEGLMALTVHATPAMLKMMIAGGVFTTLVGAVVGTIAGYKRGGTERVLMTATDIQIAIPGLPLLIVLAMAIKPSDPFVVGLILGVDAWAGLSRSIHSQVLALRSESYVEASRLMGFGSSTIVRDDILPNVMPYIMINFMGNAIRVIHASVGLYFLGVLPFTTQNWGVMINYAYNRGAMLSWQGLPWLLIPIVTISLLGFGITLFSQGMDRVFNPRVRARHAESTADTPTSIEE